jgi:hypothetical protein
MPVNDDAGGSGEDLARLVLIVTGAHLRAEEHDRPTAYALAGALARGLAERNGAGASAGSGAGGDRNAGSWRVVVCSDLWYVNHPALRACPTVSVGGPRVNALTATLAGLLPDVLSVRGEYIVQLDPDLIDLACACWGETAEGTREAVRQFGSRWAGAWLDAVTQG